MKRFLLSSAVVLALTAAAGTVYKAAADTGQGPSGMSQPPGPPGGYPPGGAPPGQCGGPGRFWRPGGWGAAGRGPGGPGFWQRRDNKFSLFAPVKNKNLSDADVKIIATALLLEHGNHDWSVSNVITEPDKSIEFSFATAHGDVVATFAIDPASGRIKRVS
jgi:hypothetical protein